MIEDKISEIKNKTLEEISKVKNLQEIEKIRVKALGKKGELTAILKMMGTLAPEERPKMGSLVNSAKTEILQKIEEIESKLKQEEINKKLE